MDRRAIRAAVKAARERPPLKDDPAMAGLRKARVGAPALVRTPAGEAALWLAPLVVGEMACGLAQVSLQGQVMRMGILGAGPHDRASWIPVAFLARPPAEALAEIAARYPGRALSQAILSYDGDPVRWGWRVEVSGEGGVQGVVFITPGGWYERPPAPGALEA